jgi:thiaminase/transcriptional activator TenA
LTDAAPNDPVALLFPPGGLLARLRDANRGEWLGYTTHGFVRGLAQGTLPQPCFRHYLVQDYLFLIHFARAYALAAYKAEALDDIRKALAAASAIADMEMGLHVKYCAGWGIGEAEMRATPEAPATIAYTRYVLERGLSGDLLDLHVALAPCVIGYAEIGLALDRDPKTRRGGNPYADWIAMYAGADYQAVAHDAAAFIEALAARRGASARIESLIRTFGEATRAEIAFWQQGLDAG